MEEDSGGTDSPRTRSNSSSSSSKEQDRFLPIANVGRIMKKVLPGNGKISKDAKETVQECVSEFISFVTGEASDKCQREKRKTINGEDVIWAITTLGFEDYVNPLKVYLDKYKEMEGERLSLPKLQQRTNQNQETEKERGLLFAGAGDLLFSSTRSLPLPFCDDQSFPLPFSSTASVHHPPRLSHHRHDQVDSSSHW